MRISSGNNWVDGDLGRNQTSMQELSGVLFHASKCETGTGLSGGPFDILLSHGYLHAHRPLTTLDPENNFVEVYGRNLGGEDTATRIRGHIEDWRKARSRTV